VGQFPVFLSVRVDTKKRGGLESSTALENLIGKMYYGSELLVAKGRTRMVGIKPILGLPTEPWALTMRKVDSEVVPQQSFFAQ